MDHSYQLYITSTNNAVAGINNKPSQKYKLEKTYFA